MSRVVSWFSCGVASAVATLEAIKKYPNIEIVYCKIDSEHPDNMRFLKECEDFYNQKIICLQGELKTHWEVFEKRNFLKGANGSPCTVVLKKEQRYKFEDPDDIQIFGYTLEEKDRAETFIKRYPEVNAEFPLIDNGLKHRDCLGIINELKIEIPAMYKLGYNHNNCIGCVKGGAGYWNKIRIDFPVAFEKMAKLERELNYKLLKKWYLDEMPTNVGNFKKEQPISCDFMCQIELEKLNTNRG